MYSLLLAALVAGPGYAPEEKAADGPKLDGKWLIVYHEEGGRRNTAWESKIATVKGNMLTYERDKEKRSLELTFGPHQTVKAAFLKGEDKEAKATHHGVYIAAKDYLCISLNHEKKGKSSAAKEDTKAGKGQPGSSGSFILILRRQRGD